MSDKTHGELVVYREDYPPRLRIERADPQIRITKELLDNARLDNPWTSVDGDRFEIADDYGKRYIYRIGEYDALTNTYEMEWPD